MQQLTTTALLSAVILISGSLKIPSPFPGGEFQLSAPIAVLICCCFGFKRYLTAGIMASILGLLLGTATIFNVIIAMVFRVVAGAVLELGGRNLPVIMLCGPLGTLAARIVLGQVLQVSWVVLTVAALPGMVFTAVAAGLMYRPALKLLHNIPSLRQQLVK